MLAASWAACGPGGAARLAAAVLSAPARGGWCTGTPAGWLHQAAAAVGASPPSPRWRQQGWGWGPAAAAAGGGGGGERAFASGRGSGGGGDDDKADTARWEWLKAQGHNVNPCNSALHPAAEAGVAPPAEGGEELPVQEAYTPQSTCWGCGPAAEEGLKLRSFRIRNGLEARVTLSDQYCAFPGIISGGVLSTIMDCHGNWTAAVALMDRAGLAAPPLTLTASVLVSFKEPAPPNVPLVVRSSVVEIKEGSTPGVAKSSVEVDVSILQAAPEGGGAERLLVSATGIFKKLGAMRAL